MKLRHALSAAVCGVVLVALAGCGTDNPLTGGSSALDSTPPSSPTNVLAEQRSSDLVLTWDASSDADVQGYGGGGKVFDWSLIPPNVPAPVVLSGGLSPANVIDGVMRVRPWAVDVSSGVEASKGVKDATLMRRFCDAVREADARIDDAIL